MAHLLIRNTVLPDRRLPLPGKVLVIGRSLDSDVPILHRSVSRRHALIEFGEEGHSLSDLGSSNGTFVGDRRLESGERVLLTLGIRFRLGKVDVILAPDEVLKGDPEESASVGSTAQTPSATGSAAGAPGAVSAPKAAATPRAGGPSGGAPVEDRKSGRRVRPALAKRASLRKKKRDALRWLGLAITVALVGLAAVFIAKIAGRNDTQPSDAVSPADEDPKKKDELEVKTLELHKDNK